MSSSTALATFTERFLTEYSDVHPTYAAYLGFHEYDGRVPDLSQEAIEGRIVYLQDALDEVNSIDADRLDGVEWLDYQLLRDAIKSSCST